jgi:hypothetical protein
MLDDDDDACEVDEQGTKCWVMKQQILLDEKCWMMMMMLMRLMSKGPNVGGDEATNLVGRTMLDVSRFHSC